MAREELWSGNLPTLQEGRTFRTGTPQLPLEGRETPLEFSQERVPTPLLSESQRRDPFPFDGRRSFGRLDDRSRSFADQGQTSFGSLNPLVRSRERRGSSSTNVRPKKPKTKVLDRTPDYEISLFGQIPGAVLQDLSSDLVFPCKIDGQTGTGYHVGSSKLLVWSCADAYENVLSARMVSSDYQRVSVLTDETGGPLRGRPVDRGDIEPHLICTVGAADRSVCVLALSTKGDAWLWSMLSPSRHTRPQFGVLDLGMKGAEVNDVIALSSHLSQRGKLDVLVASGGDIFLVSVVEGTSGKFHTRKLDRPVGLLQRMTWWNSKGSGSPIVKLSRAWKAPSSQREQDNLPSTLVLRKDSLELWSFVLSSELGMTTHSLDWEVRLNDLISLDTVDWIDVSFVNETTIVVLAKEEDGRFSVLPLQLHGAIGTQAGAQTPFVNSRQLIKAPIEPPSGTCCLNGLPLRDMFCLAWREGVLTGWITPQPDDEEEDVPFFTFSSSFYSPPEPIFGLGTTSSFSLYPSLSGEILCLTPSGRKIRCPGENGYLFTRQQASSWEEIVKRLDEVCNEIEASVGGPVRQFKLSKTKLDMKLVQSATLRWIQSVLDEPLALPDSSSDFRSRRTAMTNVHQTAHLESKQRRMHAFWKAIGAPHSRQNPDPESYWGKMDEAVRVDISSSLQKIEAALSLKRLLNRLDLDGQEKRDPFSPENTALQIFEKATGQTLTNISTFGELLGSVVGEINSWISTSHSQISPPLLVHVACRINELVLGMFRAAHRFHTEHVSPSYLMLQIKETRQQRQTRPPPLLSCGGSLIGLWLGGSYPHDLFRYIQQMLHILEQTGMTAEVERSDLLSHLAALCIFFLDSFVELRGSNDSEERTKEEVYIFEHVFPFLEKHQYSKLIDLAERYLLHSYIVSECDGNVDSLVPYFRNPLLRLQLADSLFEYLFRRNQLHKLVTSGTCFALQIEKERDHQELREYLGYFVSSLRTFLDNQCPDVLWLYDLHSRNYNLAEESLLLEEKKEITSVDRSLTLLSLSQLCGMVAGNKGIQEEKELKEKKEEIMRKREMRIQLRGFQKSLYEKMERKNLETERGEREGSTIPLQQLQSPLHPVLLAQAFVQSGLFLQDYNSIMQHYSVMLEIVQLCYDDPEYKRPLIENAVQWFLLDDVMPAMEGGLSSRHDAHFDRLAENSVVIQVLSAFHRENMITKEEFMEELIQALRVRLEEDIREWQTRNDPNSQNEGHFKIALCCMLENRFLARQNQEVDVEGDQNEGDSEQFEDDVVME